ncbi:sensor histidine kinase [Enterococcus sp. HY326]|uniref:sensor histidine kinase n=1 Tax=Enterococcus sp. HY326 TaxID=2971265 RepID=UPI0022404936|nr:sensor histidine kinase [Enterococcus sp. HY326]
MMQKPGRLLIALYAMLAYFVLFLFILFTFFYASGTTHWWVELVTQKIFFIPYLVYLVVIAAVLGLLTYFIVNWLQRSGSKAIEEKLRLLANGNYDNPKLTEEIDYSNNIYLNEMNRDVLRIQEKLVEISRELQALNSLPQLVDGSTKEEILEQERHRLARELHDSVSQQLFAAMMLLSALNEIANQDENLAPLRKQLDTVTSIINASQSEMRALLLHLRPVSLEGKSLKQGIEQLLKELQTKIQIELKWDAEEVKLSANIEDQLFRVVQELLSNTLRHSKAKELEVYLHRIGPNVLLRVVDDGVGFDVTESRAGSYGLNNIRERVAGVGGTVKIISFKKQGTSVEIKVPILEEESA